jgi:hypothetical protein
MTLEGLPRAQMDFAHFEVLVAGVAKRIAGLDPQLRDDALQQRTHEIRTAAGKELSPLLQTMAGRAQAAEQMARGLHPGGGASAGPLHPDNATNATMTLAAFARLARTPTAELVDHLEDAVAAKNLALAEAVRLEFGGRKDGVEFRQRYAAAFAKIEAPDAAAAKRSIGKIASLAAMGRERFNAATTGRSDPVARMAAARMAAA